MDILVLFLLLLGKKQMYFLWCFGIRWLLNRNSCLSSDKDILIWENMYLVKRRKIIKTCFVFPRKGANFRH